MSHVLPFFPRDARFVGVKNNLIDPAMTNRLAAEVARIVRRARRPALRARVLAGGQRGRARRASAAPDRRKLRARRVQPHPASARAVPARADRCRARPMTAAAPPRAASSTRTPARGDGWTSRSWSRAWPCPSAVSIALGQDANWDLQNYHFYGPWAMARRPRLRPRHRRCAAADLPQSAARPPVLCDGRLRLEPAR